MIKYFHRLTKKEFEALYRKKLTWGEIAKDYPQPKWCGYPGALDGIMGCWSLTAQMVTGKAYCKNCDCLLKPKPVSI